MRWVIVCVMLCGVLAWAEGGNALKDSKGDSKVAQDFSEARFPIYGIHKKSNILFYSVFFIPYERAI